MTDPGIEMLARLRSTIGRNTVYALGQGGFRPGNPMPWRSAPADGCDCSGFASWFFEQPRKVNLDMYARWNGGWFETSAIVRDANSPYGFFRGIPWSECRVGDVLVWGDRGAAQGHIGIVSEWTLSGPSLVVHCSRGNFNRTGDAIAETDVGIFQRNGAIAARWHEHDALWEVA